MKLLEIYEELKLTGWVSDKGTAHSYLPIYDYLFHPYENKSILEIGVAYGFSLRLWKKYFKSVTGIDIYPVEEIAGEIPGCKIIIGDATNYKTIEKLEKTQFDIIIDDGSHWYCDQAVSFLLLKNHLAKDGMYIIEDVQGQAEINYLQKLAPFQVVDLRPIHNLFDDILLIYSNGEAIERCVEKVIKEIVPKE